MAAVYLEKRYASVVVLNIFNNATRPNCGNILRASSTTSFEKSDEGTRVMTEPNSNNNEDWTIRSQAPKSVNDKDMEKVQRLYGCGDEESDQL